MVQWFGAFTATAQVPSLVRELRSHKPLGTEKQIKLTTTLLLPYKTRRNPPGDEGKRG